MLFLFRKFMLLAGVIVLLSLQNVDSLSVLKRQPHVTLSLTASQKRSDVHPQILLQMQINRSSRRLAEMTGIDPPSARSLEENLEKRVLSVEGPDGLRKRFNRLGGPQSLNSPVNARTFSLGLNIIDYDVGYFSTLQLGTPPRDFSVIMDSGSADFWVGAENCQSANGGGCGNHTFLGPQSSSTFQDITQPFSITYGTGFVNGSNIQDNVVIGGLTITGHQFGVATLESVGFSSNRSPDGLMGLAKSTLSFQNTKTTIEALGDNGLVQNRIVSYKIPRRADNKGDGQVTFGGLDQTKFDPNTLVTIPNISEGFWAAPLSAVTMNGVDLNMTGRPTILDTGTTIMYAPFKDAATIHGNIPGAKSDGQGGFTVPCGTTASLALAYGGRSFSIDTRDLARQPLDSNNPQGDCVSGIAAGNHGPEVWLVGDTFLKNVYFSCDFDKDTVSLAQLV